MIDGVIVRPMLQYPDARGTVKMLAGWSDDAPKESFCAVYSTTVYRGVIKGWHGYHTKTLNYTVPYGLVKLVLWDLRKGSPTLYQVDELFLGTESYYRVTIPPGVMNAFQGIAGPLSLAVVAADEPFSERRTIRFPIENGPDGYDWTKVDK